MNGAEDFERNEPRRQAPHPRAVGAPLSMGGTPRAAYPQGREEGVRLAAAPPPPGRSLPGPQPEDGAGEIPRGVQRAVNVLRQALPFVQRLLPLLDGHVGSTVSNFMTPQPRPPAPAPPVQVNLAPLADGLAELQTQHQELREQVAEQNTSLRRVEDQLEMVREATDRNTLEQQELMEDLKSVGNKVNLLALIALGLLGISILLNVVLYLHIQRVLP